MLIYIIIINIFEILLKASLNLWLGHRRFQKQQKNDQQKAARVLAYYIKRVLKLFEQTEKVWKNPDYSAGYARHSLPQEVISIGSEIAPTSSWLMEKVVFFNAKLFEEILDYCYEVKSIRDTLSKAYINEDGLSPERMSANILIECRLPIAKKTGEKILNLLEICGK